MGRWWRAYEEAATDPKLQLLPAELFRTWFNLMCIASKHEGKLPSLAHVAYTLQLKQEKAAQVLTQLFSAGLLDKTETGFQPHNWDGRQYKQDKTDNTNADRQQRYRNRQRNADSNANNNAVTSVTAKRPETETETEADTDTESSLRSDSARKRGTRLPVDWKPSTEDGNEAVLKLGGVAPASQELLKFHDYWKAQPGQRGVKLDWDATWRNWIRNAKGPTNGRRTVHDAANDLVARVAALDEPAPSGLCERAGEGSVRLLPPGRCQ